MGEEKQGTRVQYEIRDRARLEYGRFVAKTDEVQNQSTAPPSEGSLTEVLDDLVSALSAPVLDEYHVAKDGDDSNGDGSIGRPYLTVAKALSEREAGAAERAVIVVHPGEYDEGSLSLTNGKLTVIELNGAHIKVLAGGFTWDTGDYVTSEPKLIITAKDLRAYYPPTTNFYINQCIEGNFYYTTDRNSWGYAGLHLIHTGIIGDIECSCSQAAGLGNLHLKCFNGGWEGTLSTPVPAGAVMDVAVYGWSSNASGSMCIGGANGRVNPHELHNVEISEPWIVTGFSTVGGIRCLNTDFKSGSDFSGHPVTTAHMDANSYASFIAADTGGGGWGGSFDLLDKASGVENDSSVYAGVGSVKDALEDLALSGGVWPPPMAPPVLYDGRVYFDTALKQPFFYDVATATWYDALGVPHP